MQTQAWLSHVSKAIAALVMALLTWASLKWGVDLGLTEEQVFGLVTVLLGLIAPAVYQIGAGPKPMPASDAAKAAVVAAQEAKVASQDAATKAAVSEKAATVATTVAKDEKAEATAAAKEATAVAKKG